MIDNNAPLPASTPSIDNALILIVDDKPTNIEILELLLTDAGYSNIMSTTRPTEVLSLYNNHHPDLVLLDLLMPDLSGIDVLRELKQLIPSDDYVPRVILTADNSNAAKGDALRLGAHDFIHKPFDATEVILRIQNLLQTRMLQKALRASNSQLESKVQARTREIELYKVQLELANRMKYNFLATISHELRTPLTAINGFSELLLSDTAGPLSEQQKLYLADVHESGKHLTKLVETILELADIRVNDMTLTLGAVNLKEALNATVNVLKEQFHKRSLSFQLEADAALEPIVADAIKVKQMMYNYLDNAIKFSPQGGVITAYVQDSLDEISVCIQDQGSGIPKDHHHHVFEPFWQLDGSLTRRHEGTGIGLYLTKQFAELHGGRVWFESEDQQGSEFAFVLPRRPPNI
ncbi:MAG: ATP-binding protein [Deinococcota bacterium]